MISMTLLSKPGEPTWILVADGTRANVYTTQHIDRHPAPTGSGAVATSQCQIGLQPVHGMALNATPIQAYDQGHHPAERVVQSGTSNTSMSEPRESTRDHIRKDFAKEITDKINKACEQNQFSNLVIVASPSIMAPLKNGLSKKCQGCLRDTSTADLTHFSGNALLNRLNHLFQDERAAS